MLGGGAVLGHWHSYLALMLDIVSAWNEVYG